MSVTLKNVGSGFKRTAINENFTDLESEINNNLLHRDGSVPLSGNLDANGARIYNVGEGVDDNDVGTIGQIKGFEEAASASAAAAASSAGDAASSAFLSQGAYNDFASNYAGSGDTLPVTATDGQRFYYTGATFDVGEYLWLDGDTDPTTSTSWRKVSGLGPQGLQGPTGAEGIQGPIGVQGIQGPQGQTGIQGETGLQGSQGIQGADGNTGPQGTQGPQGDVGPQGLIGSTGATGSTGPQGIQGPIGLTGATGDAGTSFTVDEVGLFAGRTAFDAAADGFSYLATDHVNAIGTGSLFVKQSATNADWSTAIPFGVGPQGDQGPVGPTGATGSQGATGSTGAQGPDGDQGIQGITGTQGPQGEDGIQGPQGLQGPTGNQGPQGEDGIQGPVGDAGPDGATGPQGSQGPAGDTGPTGATGSTGPTGSQGIRGSRSYYTSGQTSWTALTALTEIGESALENDVSVQYDTATGFSESRSYSGTAPETSAANWDVVDKTVNFTPTVIGGVTSSFLITDDDSINFGVGAGATNQQEGSLAIGKGAGGVDQGVADPEVFGDPVIGNSVAVGNSAGLTGQKANATAVGHQAGETDQGWGTVAVGYKAGATNQSFGSLALGYLAASDNQGTQCVSVGGSSGGASQGNQSTCVGASSGRGTAVGATCLGYLAAFGTIGAGAGNYCTSLGRGAGTTVNSYTNSTCLGASAQITGSDQVQIGDSATTTYAYGTVQNRSDSRDKADVTGTELGLDFINALTPVQFKWDYREDYRTSGDQALSDITKDGSKKRSRQHQGFIAQDVKQVMDAQGVDFAGYQDHSIAGGEDVKSLGYEEFIAPLVKAIQELTTRLEALENA